MEQSSGLADQQERPVSTEFVAGVIVAEGYFGLTIQKTPRLKMKNGYLIRPAFALQMHDEETMQRVVERWKLLGLPLYFCRVKTGVRIQIAGCRRVRRVLDVFLPHLTGEKAKAAMIVKAFIDLRLSLPQNAPYSELEYSYVNSLRMV